MNAKLFRTTVRSFALAGGLAGSTLAAAPAPSDSAPVMPAAAAAPVTTPAGPDYLLPDLPPGSLLLEGKGVTIKPIIAIVTDYTGFSQDDASLAQVGEQENTPDLRAARIGFIMRSKWERKWSFTITTDYQEPRTRDDAVWQLYDVKFDIPLGATKLTIGKQKEPFIFEMVGLMPQLPTQERILSPFFVTRNTGVQLAGALAGDRMTWTAGAFNDTIETHDGVSDTATDYVVRVTGLPMVSSDNLNYLHLGVGLRHAGNDEGSMRFSGRPSSNVADKYLDTGSFAADSATILSLEAVWSQSSFMVLAEYVEGWVDAPTTGDPRFFGAYLTGSWVITGESRPYIRSVGYAGGITPKGRHGAVELVARYGYVDLVDGPIDGGTLDHWYLGANWWLSTQWKTGLSYGYADLDRDGLHGNTKMLLVRTQWMY